MSHFCLRMFLTRRTRLTRKETGDEDARRRVGTPNPLASSPPLRTGVATIDSFAARQRESLLSAQPNERAAYCANLVRCLEALLSGLSSASQKKIILNRQHLETASHLVYR